jgi:uncharacterized protein (UPF0276 family)
VSVATSNAVLGVGLGYRTTLHQQILNARGQIDFLEAITDHFIYDAAEEKIAELREASQDMPIVPHSLSLSVGTAEPVNADYLARTAAFVRFIDPPWYSDHLCMTQVEHVDIGSLTPLWFTEEVVENTVANARTIKQAAPGTQFLLENITYYIAMPESTMTESDFIRRVLEQADCGLLLDVNNVYINSRNLGYDPYKFLEELPLERVVQIHIAGFEQGKNLIVDTHDSAVSDEVWKILEYVCRHSPVRGISLERDSNYPEFSIILEELDHARRILRQH